MAIINAGARWDQLIICQAHHNLTILSDRPEFLSSTTTKLLVEIVS